MTSQSVKMEKPVAKTDKTSKFINSQPIYNMLALLADTGRPNFIKDGVWEVCLCAIILTLEPTCKIQRILEALPYKNTAFDEADLLNILANLGYFCRQSHCDLCDLDGRLLPALFIPKMGAPSIILSRDNETLQFYDPLSKMVSQSPNSFDKAGKIWFFQKYDENRSATSKFMRTVSGKTWFTTIIDRFHSGLAQILAAGFILNIIALATPLFIMLVYDRVISAGAIGTLPMIAMGACIAIIFEWQLRKIRARGLAWFAGRMDNIISNKIFTHLIGLSPDLIEKASVAAQIARIKTFESVRDFFSGAGFVSLLETPFVVLSIIAVAVLGGPLVFVPLGMACLYIVLFYYIRSKIKIAIRLAAKTSSARQQFTIESFEKLHAIRMHGLGHKWHEKYRHLSGREVMANFYLGWLGAVADSIAHALTVISVVCTLGVGVQMVWNGDMSAGALVAIMILIWRVLTPFYSMCTLIPRLEQLRNSVAQINNLMDIETEKEEAQRFSRISKFKGSVSFNAVSFRYNTDGNDVFSNLSFDAKSGDLVVVTGVNGSGKATILKLIQSMHDASGGTVRIDGFDVRQLDIPDLRRQIAYVPRTPFFFHGTIIENLRLTNPLAKEDQVINALKKADAWDDIQKLPNGLNQMIGQSCEEKLTAGLAARLSLASIYLNPAPLILIDELPNSVLSARAGQNLKNYIAQCKGKKTIIMCTYREDFMRMADTIVCLCGFLRPIVGPRDIMISQLDQIFDGSFHATKEKKYNA
jgi:ATP-binding cassette subfamily C protein LapB